MPDAHKNFAISAVATAPSPATSGTSLVVTSGEGSKFPAVPFNATVWPTGSQPTSANAEIVRVTARSTDTLTITRTQESTSARTIVVGDQIAATVTAKTLNDAEQPHWSKLVAPPGWSPWLLSQAGALTSQVPRGWRVVVPEAGTLHDVSVFIGTSSGNVAVAVYDTGDALGTGVRSRLYTSGSVASPGTGWRVIGDPNISVSAGQMLDVFVAADNGTVTFGRVASQISAGVGQLPTNFVVAPGTASPKIGGFTIATLTSLAFPSTIAEAGVTNEQFPPSIIARVS